MLAKELAQDAKFANITSASNEEDGSKERAIILRKRQSVSQNMFHRKRSENPHKQFRLKVLQRHSPEQKQDSAGAERASTIKASLQHDNAQLKSDVFLSPKFNQIPLNSQFDVKRTQGVNDFAPTRGAPGEHKRAKSSYGKHSKPFMHTNNLMKAPGLDTIKPADFTQEEYKRNNMYSNLIQKRPRQIDETSPQTKGNRPVDQMLAMRNEMLLNSPPRSSTAGNPLRSKSVNRKINHKFMKLQ